MVKYFKIGRYGICALGIIAIAVLLRILLIAQGWPVTNSDEGTMGLEAIHIAFRGEHPIFLYGQNYMGTIEAYLGAALFHLFGVSLFSLRLGMVILFALFMIAVYFLASLLYTKKLALASLVLLCLGSADVITREVKTVGGDVETLLFGSLILLLATWLALSSGQDQSPQRRRWRLTAYAGWGLAVGLGLWSHLLVSPFVLVGGLILVVFCRHELRIRSKAALCLLLGPVIGGFPLIYYNLTTPLSQNSLVVFWNLHRGGASGEALKQLPIVQELVGTALVSIPVSTGANPLCSLSDMPLFGPPSSDTVQCTIAQGSWGLGYLVLLTIAIVIAGRAFWKLWRQRRSSSSGWSPKERQAAILHFARLMLSSATALTIVLYALSPVAALQPWLSSRYLVGLLVATPAVISPLWNGFGTGRIKLLSTRFAPLVIVVKGAILLLIGTILLLGTISNFAAIPSTQAVNQQQYALAYDLERLGIRHIYSDYWTCNRLTFQSDEQVICSVLGEQLNLGNERYWPYHVIVTSDPRSSYVFVLGSAQATAFARRLAFSPGKYQHLAFGGYVIYKPV